MENKVPKFTDIPSVDNSKNKLLTFRGIRNKVVSMNEAIELCRLCFDADLLTYPNVAPAGSLFWLGIIRQSNKTQWTWLANGSVIDEEIIALLKVRNLNQLQPSVTYGLLVKSPNSDGYSVAVPVDEKSDKIQNVHNQHSSNRYPYIICQHSRRSQCYSRNVSESQCIYLKPYGCHKYIITQVYDDIGLNCPIPINRHIAVQCHSNECICNTTEWTHWATCSSTTCQEALGSTSRSREYVHTCHQSYAKKSRLQEKQNCAVPGCNTLQDDEDIHGTGNKRLRK